ncbi:MAG: hypothetical protein EU530_05455 [Promethearchaeota archaeon]|nr:MAG: hypothetical protein EU530_05455 [Candidatus Lokiarchaeota archaeon]
MPFKNDNERFSQVRYFRRKKYISDLKEYDSKLKAKSVVLYLKAMNAGRIVIRARIIDRGSFHHIYFDESTYKQMQEGAVKLPEYTDVPESVIRKMKSVEISDVKSRSGHKIQVFKSDYMYGRKEKYHIVRLDKEKSKQQLLRETRKKQKINAKDTLEDSLRFMLLIEILHNMYLIPDDIYDLKYWANKDAFDAVYAIWEQEQNLNESLDIIHDTFMDSCPKCGSEMKENFIVLGGRGRLAVYQCVLCKFYLPRSVE